MERISDDVLSMAILVFLRPTDVINNVMLVNRRLFVCGKASLKRRHCRFAHEAEILLSNIMLDEELLRILDWGIFDFKYLLGEKVKKLQVGQTKVHFRITTPATTYSDWKCILWYCSKRGFDKSLNRVLTEVKDILPKDSISAVLHSGVFHKQHGIVKVWLNHFDPSTCSFHVHHFSNILSCAFYGQTSTEIIETLVEDSRVSVSVNSITMLICNTPANTYNPEIKLKLVEKMLEKLDCKKDLSDTHKLELLKLFISEKRVFPLEWVQAYLSKLLKQNPTLQIPEAVLVSATYRPHAVSLFRLLFESQRLHIVSRSNKIDDNSSALFWAVKYNCDKEIVEMFLKDSRFDPNMGVLGVIRGQRNNEDMDYFLGEEMNEISGVWKLDLKSAVRDCLFYNYPYGFQKCLRICEESNKEEKEMERYNVSKWVVDILYSKANARANAEMKYCIQMLNVVRKGGWKNIDLTLENSKVLEACSFRTEEHVGNFMKLLKEWEDDQNNDNNSKSPRTFVVTKSMLKNASKRNISLDILPNLYSFRFLRERQDEFEDDFVLCENIRNSNLKNVRFLVEKVGVDLTKKQNKAFKVAAENLKVGTVGFFLKHAKETAKKIREGQNNFDGEKKKTGPISNMEMFVDANENFPRDVLEILANKDQSDERVMEIQNIIRAAAGMKTKKRKKQQKKDGKEKKCCLM